MRRILPVLLALACLGIAAPAAAAEQTDKAPAPTTTTTPQLAERQVALAAYANCSSNPAGVRYEGLWEDEVSFYSDSYARWYTLTMRASVAHVREPDGYSSSGPWCYRTTLSCTRYNPATNKVANNFCTFWNLDARLQNKLCAPTSSCDISDWGSKAWGASGQRYAITYEGSPHYSLGSYSLRSCSYSFGADFWSDTGSVVHYGDDHIGGSDWVYAKSEPNIITAPGSCSGIVG